MPPLPITATTRRGIDMVVLWIIAVLGVCGRGGMDFQGRVSVIILSPAGCAYMYSLEIGAREG